nr:MAG TPA: hypothetical protein [Caudoviricetes sp.]
MLLDSIYLRCHTHYSNINHLNLRHLHHQGI